MNNKMPKLAKEYFNKELEEEFEIEGINDKKKAECLALEFKIKSVLLNWRRLHDDVELNWENSTWKYYISYDCWYDRIEFFSRSTFISHFFGYFSSDKKAKEFYEYMKDDIHRYFQMRKTLKF